MDNADVVASGATMIICVLIAVLMATTLPIDMDTNTLVHVHGEGTTVIQEPVTIVTLPDGTEEYYRHEGGEWVRWYPGQQPQTQEANDG